jgi:hypothetical protein
MKFFVLFIDYKMNDLIMSREINLMFIALEELREALEKALDKSNEVSLIATDLSGEWEEDFATHFDDISVRIRELTDDMDNLIEEGKSIWDDWKSDEKELRKPEDDEEEGKFDSEHIQEEMEEQKEEDERKSLKV